MAEKDYYKILGVSKDATKDEIKKAYKKLAMKYHPDKIANASDSEKKEAEEKFKEINEAASVLGDDRKRETYNQYGSEGLKRGPGGFDYNNFDFRDFGFGGEFDFGDIFDTFFGGGGRSRRNSSRRGNDLRYDIEITLNEAAFGIKKTISVKKADKCDKCNGAGGTNLESCEECQGTGHVRQTRRTPFGLFQTTTTCRNCSGSGQVITNPCAECEGTGKSVKTKKIEITIPEGVEDGQQLRLSGEGEAGYRNGRTGDLYIFIHVKAHKYFERHGNDILLEVPISFVQASMGDEIEVPTLKGKADLKIPSGTQSGTIFKMRSKGIPYLNSYGSGDQLIRVDVQVPKKLSGKQKDALKEFAKASGKDVKPQKSFFGKLFG